jgi:hypothetical protein
MVLYAPSPICFCDRRYGSKAAIRRRTVIPVNGVGGVIDGPPHAGSYLSPTNMNASVLAGFNAIIQMCRLAAS